MNEGVEIILQARATMDTCAGSRRVEERCTVKNTDTAGYDRHNIYEVYASNQVSGAAAARTKNVIKYNDATRHHGKCCADTRRNRYRQIIQQQKRRKEKNIRAGPIDRRNLASSNFCNLFFSSCETKCRVALHYNTNKRPGGLFCFFFTSWDAFYVSGRFLSTFTPTDARKKKKKKDHLVVCWYCNEQPSQISFHNSKKPGWKNDFLEG